MGGFALELTITKEILEFAKQIGACSDRRSKYRVGQSIHEVSYSDLVWIEDNVPEDAEAIAKQVCKASGLKGRIALSMFGDGYGSGSGSGDGSGSGYGPGSGDGLRDVVRPCLI